VKAGSILHVYFNGVEQSYTTQTSYTSGNVTIAMKHEILGSSVSGTNNNISDLYWWALNSAALTTTRLTNEYNCGATLGGLIGCSSGQTMTLQAGSCTSAKRKIPFISSSKRFGINDF
jgi:hypothetical protein